MDFRTISSVASSTWCESSSSPAAIRSAVRNATAPISRNGCRTVVSGGEAYRASWVSSNPTTDRSCGTRSPRALAASTTPAATSSHAANTAVGGAGSANSAAVPSTPSW